MTASEIKKLNINVIFFIIFSRDLARYFWRLLFQYIYNQSRYFNTINLDLLLLDDQHIPFAQLVLTNGHFGVTTTYLNHLREWVVRPPSQNANLSLVLVELAFKYSHSRNTTSCCNLCTHCQSTVGLALPYQRSVERLILQSRQLIVHRCLAICRTDSYHSSCCVIHNVVECK